MSEAKHTPGEWTVEDRMEGGVVKADDPNRPGKRFLICKIGPSHRSHADEQMCSANGRLIAAAPDLLEALVRVVAVADRRTDEFDAARAAIAKATGAAS